MRRRPPRSTRTDTLFPTRRASDLILERARARQQVEALKHEAEILAPQQRALIAVEPFDMVPAEQEFAFGGHIEATEDVHRRRLARSRWAHHRDDIALFDIEIDAFQCLEREIG